MQLYTLADCCGLYWKHPHCCCSGNWGKLLPPVQREREKPLQVSEHSHWSDYLRVAWFWKISWPILVCTQSLRTTPLSSATHLHQAGSVQYHNIWTYLRYLPKHNLCNVSNHIPLWSFPSSSGPIKRCFCTVSGYISGLLCSDIWCSWGRPGWSLCTKLCQGPNFCKQNICAPWSWAHHWWVFWGRNKAGTFLYAWCIVASMTRSS